MKYFTSIGDQEREFSFERRDGQLFAVCGDGRTLRVDLTAVGDGTAFSLQVDGRSYDLLVERDRRNSIVQFAGERIAVAVEDERERLAQQVAGAKPSGGPRTIEAAMPGVVVDLKVAVGDVVEAGQTLLVLEAMKMQNPIQAEGPGRVTRVLVAVGEAVAGGAGLLELDDPATDSSST